MREDKNMSEITAEAVKFNAEEIAKILNLCTEIQGTNESDYTKDCAKMRAYEEIIELMIKQDI